MLVNDFCHKPSRKMFNLSRHNCLNERLTLSQTTNFRLFQTKEFSDDFFKNLMEMAEISQKKKKKNVEYCG